MTLFACGFIALVMVARAPATETIADVGRRAPLFSATSTLEIELETDLRALRDPEREPGFQPGTLRWRDDAENGAVTVGVKPRGRFRLDRQNCQFPPLFLQFPEDADGLFAGQRVVPVTTHCKTANAQYVVQEYLVYRGYAALTQNSVGVRLARTRYVDTSGRARPLDIVSFLMEHFDDIAQRAGGVVVEDLELRRGEAEPRASALVALFQYMIGNTDWSILAGHNIALLRTFGGDIVPIPYDFDFAGVIDARYAVPSELLGIRSVRQRVYRGLCRPDEIVHATLSHLESRRHTIYRMYRQTEELDAGVAKRSLRYYDRFFDTIESPKTLKRKILDVCR